ncbi:hypothetical protein [Rothia nasisuis]|uniref:hypothetical protein n=1 Tax=Rothia nasisuis TaxID=2109647 RepID=UPI001F41E0AF|nr:hypothetical protein [Rothia nasisuis]
MRGLLIYPAQVPVLLVFEEGVPELFDNVMRAWEGLAPQVIDDVRGQVPDYHHMVVLSERAAHELYKEYSAVPELSVVNSSNPAAAAEQLTVQVTLQVLKHYSGSVHLLHAAVVGDQRTRGAFALVAASGTGKTTASRVLGREFAYLSDETAVIRPDRSIVPYLKPLSVIENEGEPKVQYAPQELGLRAVEPDDESYRLEHIIVLNRIGKPHAPTLERIPLGQALFNIVAQSSGVQASDRGLGALIDLINGVGGALLLTYSEIAQATPLLRDVLAGRWNSTAEHVEYEHVPRYARGGLPLRRDRSELARSRETEGVAFEGRYYLTTQGMLSEVSLIAWDLWSAAERPITFEDLYDEMVELYGAISRSDFDAAVYSMVEAGMLDCSREPEPTDRLPKRP